MPASIPIEQIERRVSRWLGAGLDGRGLGGVETARSRGASAVAVGHTRDDQAETVLHRLIRGTDPRGLGGMPARRSLGEGLTLVRPLLSVARADVRLYLESIGQPFGDDPTNADRSRTRARIRHDLLPRLAAEYNPRVVDALARLGDLARSANLGTERQAAALWRRAAVWSEASRASRAGPGGNEAVPGGPGSSDPSEGSPRTPSTPLSPE